MLEQCFHRPHVLRRLRVNPLAEDLERLAAYLRDRGHPPAVLQAYLQAAEHFGHWVGRRGIRPTAVDDTVVERFLTRHLPRCRCPLPSPRHLITTRAALKHLLRLRPGRWRGSDPPSKQPAIETLLQGFESHMLTTCALAPATRQYRRRYAREFLQGVFGRGPLLFRQITVGDPITFITRYARRCSPATAQVAASALRGFLRFLQLQGLCDERLAAAVPRIPDWRLAGIPRTLTERQLKQFLESFDRLNATGRRDYAMALCMVDLGLRVSEVAHLRLEDVDWRQATLRIAGGKSRRCHVLPLPRRVGQAIAGYLRRGRPRCRQQGLFLRHRAPWGVAVHEELVRGVIRRAYARCGFDHRWTGTHLLRHTAAMMRRDLAAARKAWMKEASNAKARKEREQSFFLAYRDASNRVADFHALRHTFITRLARSGVAPAVAKSLARHSTIVLTMDHYTHTLIEDERAALDRLPSINAPRANVAALGATVT